MGTVMTPAGLTDYKIADITLATWDRRELIIAESETLTLMGPRRKYVGQQPLKGARILGYVHVTIQTDVLTGTSVTLDVEVRWSNYNISSTQDQVTIATAAAGIPVLAWKGETKEEYEWCIEQTIPRDGRPQDTNMALDDDGDLTEILHKKYPQMLEHIHSTIEETIIGTHRLLDMLEDGTLKVPATNINDSATKNKNNNKCDCRHSLNDAVRRDTDHLLSGKRALAIGYGDVGKGSSQPSRREGMIVKVVEVGSVYAIQACMDGFEVAPLHKSGTNDGTETNINAAPLGKINLIITTTGNVNVYGANILKALKKRMMVCNIGHLDNEIDTAFIHKDWAWEEVEPQVYEIHRTGKDGSDTHNDDYLVLFAEGRLVNPGSTAGHPSRIMDGSFANQVLAQIHPFEQKYVDLSVVEKAKCLSVEVLPRKLDEGMILEMIRGFGGVITQLTPKQAKYIGVSVEDSFKPDTYRR